MNLNFLSNETAGGYCYENFSYNNVDEWGDTWPKCKQGQQSPIDLVPDNARYHHNNSYFRTKNFDQKPTKATLVNSGSTGKHLIVYFCKHLKTPAYSR